MKKEEKRKKKVRKKLCIITIIILVILLPFIIFYKESRTLRINNVIYSERNNVINEFEGKYKEYYLVKVEGFTHYYDGMYLRLISMNEFDDVYASGQVFLTEGNWPTNNKEVVLPVFLKEGTNFSEGKKSYSIGDVISLNHTEYRNKVEVVKALGNYIDAPVKYSISCAAETPYVVDEKYDYEEYKVVGFFDYYMYSLAKKNGEDLVFDNWSTFAEVDIITYLNNDTLKDDDHINIVMKLNYFSYTKKQLSTLSYDLVNKYGRYDESVQSMNKTCNDNFSIGYSSAREMMKKNKVYLTFE